MVHLQRRTPKNGSVLSTAEKSATVRLTVASIFVRRVAILRMQPLRIARGPLMWFSDAHAARPYWRRSLALLAELLVRIQFPIARNLAERSFHADMNVQWCVTPVLVGPACGLFRSSVAAVEASSALSATKDRKSRLSVSVYARPL